MPTAAWWIVAGVGLGAAFVRWARPRAWRRARRPLGVGLTVAALVYVGFAAVGGGAEDVVRATVGVIFFGGFAVLGTRTDRRWLAAGWGLHVLWDAALHWSAPQVAPAWYAFLCFGFDPVVAGAILVAPRPAEPEARESLPRDPAS